jgi:4-amino-4-deoxy-L-arabinose transferase-like glycosyltransferase
MMEAILKKNFLTSVLFLLLVGILVRILFFTTLIQHPISKLDFHFKSSDMHGNLEWVNQILLGDVWGKNPWHPQHSWMLQIAPMETWLHAWGGKEIFQQAPLYPYWLAFVCKLSNNDFHGIRALQHAIGIITALLIYGIGRKLFGQCAGFFAGLLSVLYFPFLCVEFYFLRDFLALHFLAWFLLLSVLAREKESWIWTLGAGFILGLAILTRENLLIILPCIPWVLSSRSHPQFWKRAVLGFLGLMLAFFPLGIRNVLCGAPVFAISNRLLECLIEGLAFDATPAFMCVPDSMQRYLLDYQGRILETFFSIVSDYPSVWAFWERLVEKGFALFHFLEPFNNLNLYYFTEQFPWLHCLISYPALILVALPGLAMIFRKKQGFFLLPLFFALVLGLLIGPILARYRLILIPFYLLWAGVTLGILYEKKKWLCGIVFLGLPFLAFCMNNTLNPSLKDRPTERTLVALIQEKIF